MESDINFKNNNPGAVRFGNFINYYEFHPAQNRIKMLPDHVWNFEHNNSIFCLDIGCNAGVSIYFSVNLK